MPALATSDDAVMTPIAMLDFVMLEVVVIGASLLHKCEITPNEYFSRRDKFKLTASRLTD